MNKTHAQNTIYQILMVLTIVLQNYILRRTECHFQIAIAPMSLIHMTVLLVQSHEKCGTWGQTDVPYVLHYG